MTRSSRAIGSTSPLASRAPRPRARDEHPRIEETVDREASDLGSDRREKAIDNRLGHFIRVVVRDCSDRREAGCEPGCPSRLLKVTAV